MQGFGAGPRTRKAELRGMIEPDHILGFDVFRGAGVNPGAHHVLPSDCLGLVAGVTTASGQTARPKPLGALIVHHRARQQVISAGEPISRQEPQILAMQK